MFLKSYTQRSHTAQRPALPLWSITDIQDGAALGESRIGVGVRRSRPYDEGVALHSWCLPLPPVPTPGCGRHHACGAGVMYPASADVCPVTTGDDPRHLTPGEALWQLEHSTAARCATRMSKSRPSRMTTNRKATTKRKRRRSRKPVRVRAPLQRTRNQPSHARGRRRSRFRGGWSRAGRCATTE